jgi:hypothetical protein
MDKYAILLRITPQKIGSIHSDVLYIVVDDKSIFYVVKEINLSNLLPDQKQ